ncbi:hypothetical protein BC939DRAFT_500768 [Gamsiella multidivaricata]|uniref:uncharacterized protein n=1 Tax=Gamsiella multidivaricata TaxID=101098 RepID=UPI0022205E35|nr:uncharacterized protein BC939DRAFT_500768 [Gamsiella multidivaricata]KAG0359411.1 hypothetical protein BGZ54_009966 [Gamsiella multidivaricata]KAI7828668.1 hypothetical protein BC939DRAFT_500768 [Gamsiella multidivaricata]
MPARVIGTTTMPDFATELLNGDFDQEDLEDHDLSDGFNKGDSDGDEGSYEDQDDSGNNSNHWASFAPSRTYAHGRETDPAPSEQYQTFSATSSYVNSGSSGGVDNDWIFATVPTPAKSVSTAFTATPVATTPSSEAVEREARRRRFERHASRGLQDEASSSSPEALSALKRKRRRKGKDLQRYVLLKNAQLLD